MEQTRILLARVKQRRSEKSLLLTGLRGVGKTVLLNEIDRIARTEGCQTISIEAHEDKPLGALLAPPLRQLLFGLDRIAGTGDKARRALAVLKSFASSIKVTVGDVDIGLNIQPERGTADSGDIEVDLPSLFMAVAEAAEDRRTVVTILIDEVQYFRLPELSALIMAMHKMQQRQLPLVLVAAGLPILPALAGESKSYAERLFSFPDVGALSQQDAFKALQEPVLKAQVEFAQDALAEIFQMTEGYPYFLQEWGYQAWNQAKSSPITLEVLREVNTGVINSLDANFFRVRFDRLTPGEKDYLRAMAELGQGPYRSGDIAALMGRKLNDVAPRRDKLIKKGMIYSPAHGDMAFTVPLFDRFMRRAMPTVQAPAKQKQERDSPGSRGLSKSGTETLR